MSDILSERIEKLLSLFKGRPGLFQYLGLLIILIIGWITRAKPIRNLIDITTQGYISIELDSTLYLRYAEYIAEHGKLFATDILRFSPLGANVDITVFSSYFVGYLHRVLSFFGFDGSVALVNNYYPLIATAIMTIFLFLLIRRMFNWKTGLLSALLINIAPAFIFRSMGGSSDHDILGVMFVVMAFYFYLLALQSKNIKFNVLFGFLAGIIAVLGLLTAGSINFFFLAASVFILIEIVFDKFTKNDLAVLTSFLVTFTVILLAMKRMSFLGLASSFTTGSFYLAFVAGVFYLYVYKKGRIDFFINKYKYLRNIPPGIFSLGSSLILVVIFLTSVSGFGFIQDRIASFFQQLFKTFSFTRWVITVAENRRPYVQDWLGQYGKFIVYSFILGAIVLFYDAVKNSKRAKYLTLSFAIFILLYIFSRYSGDSVLNGETSTSHFMFFGSIIFFVVVMLGYYFYSYYKERDEFEALTKYNKQHTLMLAWTFIMILIATSAIRFLFEFTLIIVILASYFFVYILDLFLSRKGNLWKYVGVVLFVFVLFSPFSFAEGLAVEYYKDSNQFTKFSGPGYNHQWQVAGQWARENTPENAVFAHWWDYGYWVQSGFQRATVGDGGNFYGWWNYLMGRYFLTSQTDEEPLKFLKTHNVDYVLVLSDEIGKYPAYSSIGSDKEGDRYAYIPTFGLNNDLIRKTRNGTVLVYTGGAGIDEDVNYNGQILPRGATVVVGVEIPIAEIKDDAGDLQSQLLLQPSAIINYQGQRIDLKLKCLYFDRLYLYEDYNLDACFRVIPVIVDQNNMVQYGAGLYLSKRVMNGFVGRMYLLNQESEYFKLVYDDNNNGVPLAMYQGRIIGPIRVWEVNYPENLDLSEEEREYFMLTSYPDNDLLKPL